jgi:hypothetical protein
VRDFHSPLLELLRARIDLADEACFIVPGELDAEALNAGDVIASRHMLAVVDDLPNFSIMKRSANSLTRAMIAGMQIPGDIAEGLVIRRSIGRVRFDVATTASTLVVTRKVEPCCEYERLCATPADQLEGWFAVPSDAPGVFGQQFPLWTRIAADGVATRRTRVA